MDLSDQTPRAHSIHPTNPTLLHTNLILTSASSRQPSTISTQNDVLPSPSSGSALATSTASLQSPIKMASSPSPERKPANNFVLFMRQIYHPLGFKKGYNFPLFIIAAGAMLGFTLARSSYLNVTGTASHSFRSSASPGEWYQYRTSYFRVGIILHLAGIIPGGFLAVFQFVPIIRHKVILFHRINGYLVILLALIGNAGALMIARKSFGGTLVVQVAVGVLAIMTTGSLALAYYNIKRLQIDQHRAWMLRAWFYFGAIITMRPIMTIAAHVISSVGTYYQPQQCAQIAYNFGEGSWSTPRALPPPTRMMYPQCLNATGNTYVAVNAKMSGGAFPEQVGAALGLSFGMAVWLAVAIHALGVETYLWLTPAEGARLRQVSYERQLEAGMERAGNAGLTVDRLGDAVPFVPVRKEERVVGGKEKGEFGA